LACFPSYKIVELSYSLVIKELILILALHELALFCIKRSICRTFFTIVERISPVPTVLYPLSRRAAPVAAGWLILAKTVIFHKSLLMQCLEWDAKFYGEPAYPARTEPAEVSIVEGSNPLAPP
jgi:hypothetical protein